MDNKKMRNQMKLALLLLGTASLSFSQAVNVNRLKCGNNVNKTTAIPVSVNNQMLCFILDSTLSATPPTSTAYGFILVNIPPVFATSPNLPLACGAQGPPGSYPLYTFLVVYGTGRITLPGTTDSLYVSLNDIHGICQWFQVLPPPPAKLISWDWVGPPLPSCGPGGTFDVSPGARVYIQAVAGVSPDAFYICGQNAAQAMAGTGELIPLATAP